MGYGEEIQEHWERILSTTCHKTKHIIEEPQTLGTPELDARTDKLNHIFEYFSKQRFPVRNFISDCDDSRISTMKYVCPDRLSDFPLLLRPKNDFGKTQLHPLTKYRQCREWMLHWMGSSSVCYCWDVVVLTIQGLYQDRLFVSIISGLPINHFDGHHEEKDNNLWNDNIFVLERWQW